MSSSGELHRLTVDLIASLPQPAQQQAREAFTVDFDPWDVIPVLTTHDLHNAAETLRWACLDHQRVMWGAV